MLSKGLVLLLELVIRLDVTHSKLLLGGDDDVTLHVTLLEIINLVFMLSNGGFLGCSLILLILHNMSKLLNTIFQGS